MRTTTEENTGSVEIALKYPLSSITRLTMRRVKVRDTLAAQRTKGGNAEQEIALFANLCEVTPEQIEALDLADYQQLQNTYTGFLS